VKAAPATDAAVEFIQTLSWDKLPDRALDVVKTAFIDTAGVMLAGVGMAPMHVLRSTLSSCSDDKGSATVVGGTARATAPDAALANGAAAHILDLDDWSLTS
jgi:2-methylcitrate dehydratase PrpD